MAHFAKIENGIVQNVIVIADADCGGGNFPESEPAGQAFIASLSLDGEWKQTSYNTYRYYEFDENGNVVFVESRHADGKMPLRGQYASIGDRYDAELDEFITPQVGTPE
jgi:hypothetical protein